MVAKANGATKADNAAVAGDGATVAMEDGLDLEPPFARHHRTAELILRTLQQALQPQFEQRGALTADDFNRAIGRVFEHAPALVPLFAQNCRACLDNPIPAEVRFAQYREDGRRRDFVTRLLFSSIVTRTPESVDPMTGDAFPRLLAPGLQTYLSGLFYDKEWEALNADAHVLYQKIGADRDDEVWRKLGRDETLPVIAHAVFVRVLLRFKQFAFQRQLFVRRMGELLRDRRFSFTEDHFIVVFDSLFSHLRDELKTELGRARMDTRYGDETSNHLLRIFDEFDRHRQQQATPVRSLAGGQKFMRIHKEPGFASRMNPARR